MLIPVPVGSRPLQLRPAGHREGHHRQRPPVRAIQDGGRGVPGGVAVLHDGARPLRTDGHRHRGRREGASQAEGGGEGGAGSERGQEAAGGNPDDVHARCVALYYVSLCCLALGFPMRCCVALPKLWSSLCSICCAVLH